MEDVFDRGAGFEDEPDFTAEYFSRKAKRRRSLKRQASHRNRMRKKIAVRGYKPSIRLDRETRRVKRAKNSDCQRRMKRHSNKVLRRLRAEKTATKGNGYRRWYDYWYTWI